MSTFDVGKLAMLWNRFAAVLVFVVLIAASCGEATSQRNITLSPGESVTFETDTDNPMLLSITNESVNAVAFVQAGATIDGVGWSAGGKGLSLPVGGGYNSVTDFKGNQLLIFNTTNANNPATITVALTSIRG